LAAGTPLLAISYHKKTDDFMAQCGLEQYCIPDTEISRSRLISIFDQIKGNLDEIHKKENEVVYGMSVRVREDFSKMINNVS
jgi:polysaccharide pyruvyl transferase WcaK-like protein